MNWLPVVGYEGFYSVSDTGLVRSEDRHVPHNRGEGNFRFYTGRVLRPATGRKGYKHVGLARAGINKTQKIHRLVLEAFVGPANGLDCCHGNGITDDNRLENLRWDTKSENSRDTSRHGNNPKAKLSVEDVEDIRWLRSLGVRQKRLAKEFGVNESSIHFVVKRQSYAWVA